MELFDTHFHYYGEESPREYYDRIKIPELKYLLATGADFEESRQAREFAETIDDSWFAAGAHPHSASKYTAGIGMFDEFKGHDKLVAVGELGLDFFYENSARAAQYAVFEKFLERALEWELPAIVHCRDKDDAFDAYRDCYNILRDFAASGGAFVVHCFCGTPGWAEKFLELGAFLGITGIVTFPKAENIRAALAAIPDDRLLLETDSPYLAPKPHRGKTNHPGYLINIAETVAELRGMPVEQLAALATANAFKLFRIKN